VSSMPLPRTVRYQYYTAILPVIRLIRSVAIATRIRLKQRLCERRVRSEVGAAEGEDRVVLDRGAIRQHGKVDGRAAVVVEHRSPGYVTPPAKYVMFQLTVLPLKGMFW